MPLYEYECQSCSRRIELLQRFSDAPLATCPHCGGAVRKLPSAPAVQFKGTGWYVTDYARAGKGNGSKESSEPKGGTGEAGAGKSAGDTQPTKSATASSGD